MPHKDGRPVSKLPIDCHKFAVIWKCHFKCQNTLANDPTLKASRSVSNIEMTTGPTGMPKW